MTRNLCTDPFLRGYLDAALFTTDPSPPGGQDYVDCGRADDMFPRLPADFIAKAMHDCSKFEAQNGPLLEQAGDDEQNGADFWYTRNGHGVGFWDRGYPDDVADPLSEAARKFGEHYLGLGGWWLNSYNCKCGECWTRPEDADNDPAFGEDKCDKCGATVESENRKRGENMEAIEEPQEA